MSRYIFKMTFLLFICHFCIMNSMETIINSAIHNAFSFQYDSTLSPDQISIVYPDGNKHNYTLETTSFLKHHYFLEASGEGPKKAYNSFIILENAHDQIASIVSCSELKEYVLLHHFGNIFTHTVFLTIEDILKNVKDEKHTLPVDLEAINTIINACIFTEYLDHNKLFNSKFYNFARLKLFICPLFHQIYLPLVLGKLSIEKEQISFAELVNEKPNEKEPWYVINEDKQIIIEVHPTEVEEYIKINAHMRWKEFLKNNTASIFNSETLAIIPYYLKYTKEHTQTTQLKNKKNNSFLSFTIFKSHPETTPGKKVLHIFALVHFLKMYEKINLCDGEEININSLVHYQTLYKSMEKIAETILI